MTNTAAALYSFFSGFGLKAYTEYNVPDNATLPYITYQDIQPDWRGQSTLYARLWYRSNSLREISAKADEIAAAVGEAVSLPTPGGFVMLSKDSPFAQLMPMEGDDTLRVIYLLFTIQAYTT